MPSFYVWFYVDIGSIFWCAYVLGMTKNWFRSKLDKVSGIPVWRRAEYV